MKENLLHNHISLKEIFKKLSESLDRVLYNYFFKKYFPRLKWFGLLFIKQHNEAEKVLSDEMINILKKRKKIATTDKIEKDIFISVKNKFFKYLIKSKEQEYTDKLESETDLLLTKFVSQKYEYLENEYHQVVKSIIDALSPKRKLMFNLIRENGFNMIRENGLKFHKLANLFDFSRGP